MDLEQFISNALGQIIRAVDDAADAANREIILYSRSDSRTIEFDIAVTAEDVVGSDGKVGIKVISMGELGGNISKQTKNSTVSRIQFGVDVSTITKKDTFFKETS